MKLELVRIKPLDVYAFIGTFLNVVGDSCISQFTNNGRRNDIF